jgi:hypothetical protein
MRLFPTFISWAYCDYAAISPQAFSSRIGMKFKMRRPEFLRGVPLPIPEQQTQAASRGEHLCQAKYAFRLLSEQLHDVCV